VWSSPVDVSTVSDPHDMNYEAIVKDLVHDPVHPDTHPIGVVLTGQLRASGRSGIICEQIDRGAHSLLFLAGQRSECLDRASGDVDAVATHRRPRSAFTSSQGT
jgi:hypothetical protein